jgi:hypothetical protein
MGEVFLIDLTSLIMKQLIEVEICKIVLIFFLDECLGYVTRKAQRDKQSYHNPK